MKKITHIFILFAALGVLSSCGVYSKYSRNEVEVVDIDSLYRYQDPMGDTTSIAQLSWRTLFTDPYLQQLIEQGLANNSDLNIARLKVTEAESALKSARLAYIPSFALSPQAGVTSIGGHSTYSYGLGASASWELDIFGKLTNAKEQQKAVLEQSKSYQQAVQTGLISTIANSYYTILMLDEQIAISYKTISNWDENLRVMQALKKAGRTTETAVLQAEANKLGLLNRIEILESNVEMMENTLASILFTTPRSIQRGELSEYTPPSELYIGVPLQLLSNRPDVRNAEYILSQKFYAVNQSRAEFYPSITLSGTLGWTGESGNIALDPAAMLFNAVGSLVQPLFSKGKLKAQLEISKAQQQEALLSFNQALLNAGMEVNNALLQCQSARKRLDISTEHIAVLQDVVNGAELLMKHRGNSYLEVLTAQYTLLQTELSATNDHFEEIDGVINLYRSLGGGVN